MYRTMYLIIDPVAEILGAGKWAKQKSSGTSNQSKDWAGRRHDGKARSPHASQSVHAKALLYAYTCSSLHHRPANFANLEGVVHKG